MFTYCHEYSVEVAIPSQKVWDFCVNPINWPRWLDQIESCQLEGELKVGSTIKAKAKNREIYLPILITDLQPFSSCTSLIKNFLCTQIATFTVQSISPENTLLTIKASVTSILTPFVKRMLIKNVENSNAKLLKVLLEENSLEYSQS